MPQKMISLYQDNTTISSRQKRLMCLLSGLMLGALEFALMLDTFYFHIYYFHIPPSTLIEGAALLYFVAPIPLSFYISRQTGSINEGLKGGSITGFIGALLTVLAMGAYILVTGRMLPGLYPGPERGDVVFFILVVFAFLHAIGALFSILGAAIGSGFGKIGKRTVS